MSAYIVCTVYTNLTGRIEFAKFPIGIDKFPRYVMLIASVGMLYLEYEFALVGERICDWELSGTRQSSGFSVHSVIRKICS